MAESKRPKNGYDTAEVGAMLNELEKQLEKANSHNAEIDRRLAQAENVINGVSNSLSQKEKSFDKLNEYIYNSQQAMQRQFEEKISEIQSKAEYAIENAQKQSVAENNAKSVNADSSSTARRTAKKASVPDSRYASMVGSIFLKAYESGSDITWASKKQANDMLDDLEITADKAKTEFEKAKSLFTVKSKRILSMIDDINAQAVQFKEQIGMLEEQFDNIISLYENVDEVKKNTKSNISKIIDEYEQAAKDLLEFELDEPKIDADENMNAAVNSDNNAAGEAERMSVSSAQNEQPLQPTENNVQPIQQNEPTVKYEPVQPDLQYAPKEVTQQPVQPIANEFANLQTAGQNEQGNVDTYDENSANDFADENAVKPQKIVEFGNRVNLSGGFAGGFGNSMSDFANDKSLGDVATSDTAADFVNEDNGNSDKNAANEFHVHENPRPKEVAESTLSDFTEDKPDEKKDGSQPPRSQNILSLLNKYTNLK